MNGLLKGAPRRLRLAAAAFAAAAALVFGAGVAPAFALSGHQLDGTYPDASGSYCMNGASRIYQAPIRVGGTGASVGTFEVWYSSSCGTNWVRAYNGSPFAHTFKTIRWLNNPPYREQETDYAWGWTYSGQIYAPGSTCIHADVLILNQNTGDFYAWAGVNLC